MTLIKLSTWLIALTITVTASTATLKAQVNAPAAPEKEATKSLSPSSTPAPRNDPWWENRHANQVKNANTKAAECELVFIGDSITQSWEDAGKKTWDKHFAQWNALNLGISGDHTQHVLWRLQNGAFPDALQPKVAVVMIGTNNSGHGNGQPAHETADGVRLIVDEIHARSPETKILLNAVFARGANSTDEKRLLNDGINKIISKLGERSYVYYQDINDQFLDEKGNLIKSIVPDLLHPNSKGYEIWSSAILPVINKLMRDPLTSASGFKAIFVPQKEEGIGHTEIWKDGKKLTTILNSRPKSFSPIRDLLLLTEHAPGHDCQHYLLDIGNAEFTMKGDRSDYVFGGRDVVSEKWSDDASSITLGYLEDEEPAKTQTFKVKELLNRK